MAIRKFTNPREIDLSPGLQDVLRRNGIQAHITLLPTGEHELIVMGHDSPVLNYKLTDQQVENLMHWGSNYTNKKAYNTFTSIVKDDFDMPMAFVTAKNAFGRVAMGLHGYRIGAGEYGYGYGRYGTPLFRPPHRSGRGWFGDFLGWAPRHQDGWHLRRIGDRTFRAGGPMVQVRPDGRVKPGEAYAGSYGFYYKGNRQQAEQRVIDQVVADPKIKVIQAPERPTGQAKPLSDAITAKVYFTNGKFQDVLASHGIIIDAAKKEMTIQSANTRRDVKYQLTDEELRKLTAPTAKGKGGVSVNDRLAIINDVIGVDFKDKVTLEMLNSKNMITVDFKPEVKAELEADFIEQDRLMAEQQEIAEQNRRFQEAKRAETQRVNAEEQRIKADPNAVSGRQLAVLMPGRGFFNSVDGGRQMVVGEIRVDQTRGGHYIMSAVINGERVSHGITEKEYNKFLALDDTHRLKLFDKKFDEVVIHKGDGRGEDDMYLQNGYVRNPSMLTGEFRDKGLSEQEIINFAEKANLDNRLMIPWGVERDPLAKWNVSNIEVYSVNELLEKVPYLKGTIDSSRLEQMQGKYVLTARVDGELITKEISKAQYDAFAALDKKGQMTFFNDVFVLKDGTAQRAADEKVYITSEQLAIEHSLSNSVNGQVLQDLNEKKGFYREGRHGREVEIGEITVERDPKQEGKYKMTAVIDGKAVSHEISQKDFDKFLAVDDMQRMKLFSKIFDEVDMKTQPGQGTNVGAAILAAVVAGGEALDFADYVNHSRPRPEIYESHMGGGHYYKPGVVHPAEVAAATFEADMMTGRGQDPGRGRGV